MLMNHGAGYELAYCTRVAEENAQILHTHYLVRLMPSAGASSQFHDQAKDKAAEFVSALSS